MKLTPTEQRIYEMLSDGRLHKRSELMTCLADALASRQTFNVHMSYLRRKLPKGFMIDCVLRDRTLHYRLARFLHDGDE